MRFRFVHAADLHLDTPFEGVARTAPRVAEQLRDASLHAFDALIDLALAREADFLLLAGDIYDGAERGVRAQLRFRAGLERLDAAGIRTFIVHGNHDPLDGWSAIRTWPPGVHIFRDAPESVPVERGGERLATVHGVSYGRRDVSENLALRFPRPAGPGPHIGLLHCTVGAVGDHAPYSPCTLSDLRAAGMDYWALGHIHQRQVLASGGPWVVYPGNLQGRSPKPSERGAKGAVVVEAGPDGIAGVEFAPLDRARFLALEVEIDELADLPALHDRLQAEADRLREEHAGRGLLLRATLTGRGALHADLRRPGTVAELLRELRGAAEELSPFLWWDALRVETAAVVDREAILRRDDFAAEVLRRAARLAAGPAAPGAEPAALAADPGALASEPGAPAGPGALEAEPAALAAFVEGCTEMLSAGNRRKWLKEIRLAADADLLREAEALAMELLERGAEA